MRVVSLLPAATEIVYALGVEPVGVSQECDHPPAARAQPSVNFSRVDAEATSDTIDEQVRTAVADGDGVYGIHTDLLAELEPDVIVAQGMCDVCAVDAGLVEEAVQDLDCEPDIVRTDPHSLADVFEDIRTIGRALDRESAAVELVSDLTERVNSVDGTAVRADDRPETVVLDWLDPVMVAGHWVPELVELAGGTYPLAESGERSTPREWKTIRQADPEVLVAAPCGFDLEQIRENRRDLTERPGWRNLKSVASGRAYAADGNSYFNRPGPRLVDTLEALAGIFHPDLFEAPDSAAVRAFDDLATTSVDS
jgi:iron complex transport system substrate-binding protein